MNPLGVPTHELSNPSQERCVLCGSQTAVGSQLCPLHHRVGENVRTGYVAWNRAYGSISFENYLARLSKISETGGRVKEIIRYYQSNPDKRKD